jgi:hypothetical protein
MMRNASWNSMSFDGVLRESTTDGQPPKPNLDGATNENGKKKLTNTGSFKN